MPILGQIWSFLAKYCHFLHILSNVRPKNNVNKVPRWVFRYVGNKTFDFSSIRKGFFAQKRPNLAQNWHFWSMWARPCRLIRCPVGGSVGGCGARAVSRKTPIYFMYKHFVGPVFDVVLGFLFSHWEEDGQGGSFFYCAGRDGAACSPCRAVRPFLHWKCG